MSLFLNKRILPIVSVYPLKALNSLNAYHPSWTLLLMNMFFQAENNEQLILAPLV
jgi:hypothetical protein